MNQKQLDNLGIRYAASWSSQDPKRLASHYAPEGTLKVNNGNKANGRDEIEETARGFMHAFPDMIVRMDSIKQTENGGIFYWTWTGTNTGPGGNGRSVNIRGYEIWTLNRNGDILESLGHYDELDYQRQMSDS